MISDEDVLAGKCNFAMAAGFLEEGGSGNWPEAQRLVAVYPRVTYTWWKFHGEAFAYYNKASAYRFPH